MATSEAIGAQVVSYQYSALFIMRESLELGTCVKGMFFGLADDAIVGGSTCVCGEGCDLA